MKLPAVLRDRKFGFLLIPIFLLTLCGCAGLPSEADGSSRYHVVTSTYPIYVLTCAVSAGSDQIYVSKLSTGEVSCLHNYTLTVSDMRSLEEADLLILNGAGLEDFLDHALSQLSVPVTDCSEAVTLFPSDEIRNQEETYDPHYWMDPRNAILMTETISQALSGLDPEHSTLYQDNAQTVSLLLRQAYEDWLPQLDCLSCPYLITFHDGFQYFADAFHLNLLFSLEEEDGSTASARDILTASSLVKEYSLPSIFVEKNGSDSAARAVSGETGAGIAVLSMIMDGKEVPEGGSAAEILQATYLYEMNQNIEILAEVLK